MVVFVPITRVETLISAAESVGFRYVQPWHFQKKNPPVAIRNVLQWSIEHMIYFTKGKHRLRVENKGKCPNIFSFPVEHRKRIHKTQKPVLLMKKLIELTTDEDQTVLDPFAGSGSTGLAALSTNRKFIGIEKDPEHFRDALEWFDDFYRHDQFGHQLAE